MPLDNGNEHFWDTEKVILDQDHGRDKVKVKAVTRRGRRYVDIRIWWGDGWLQPGRGVTLWSPEEARTVAEAIIEATDE